MLNRQTKDMRYIKTSRRFIRNIDGSILEMLKGAGVRSFLRAVGFGASFVFYLLISRLFGASAAGMYSLSLTVLGLVSLLALLGTQESTVRFVAQTACVGSSEDVRKVHKRIARFTLISSIIYMLALLSLAPVIANRIFQEPALRKPLYAAALALPFLCLTTINAQSFRGMKHIALFTLTRNIMPPGLGVLLLGIVIIFPVNRGPSMPIYAYAAALILTGIVSVALWHKISRRSSQPSQGHFSPPSMRTILSVSLPMLTTAGMILVLNMTDSFMLGIYRTSAEVGTYKAAFKIAMVVNFFVDAMQSIAAPKITGLYWTDKLKQLHKILTFSSSVIFWISLPCYLIIVVFAEPILRIFGSEFIASRTCLIWLSSGVFVRSTCGLVGCLLQMTGRQKAFRNIMMIGAGLNILLNMLLIPKYGPVGAAIATAASSSTWCLIASLYARRQFGYWVGFVPSRTVRTIMSMSKRCRHSRSGRES